MKFLLNMNVPRQVGQELAARGHPSRHVGDIGMSMASDREIVEEARENGEVVVITDLDYGHLLAFSGRARPSVIIFRLRNTHPDNLLHQVLRAWEEIEEPLAKGAIVVLEDAALRVRKLPIARS